MTRWQRLLHWLGWCPRNRAGHPYSGAPGRCGWEWER